MAYLNFQDLKNTESFLLKIEEKSFKNAEAQELLEQIENMAY